MRLETERKRWLTVAALVLAAAAGAGAGGEAERVRPRGLIGQPAPPLSIDEVIAGDELAAWAPEALAGRAVVVDFWSTWCAPCVEDLPRWNEMVDELAGEPVVFVAVSDEPAADVRAFLAKRRLAGWVAVDPDGSAFEAFGVTGRPHAVLIDPQGVVRGEGHTGQVTPPMVRRLLAGEDPGLEPQRGLDELLAEVGGGADDAIFQVGLWPTRASGGRLSRSSDGLVAQGLGLRVLVPVLWQVPAARVVLEDVPAGRFDLVVKPAGAADRVEALGREALERGLGLAARRETRDLDVLVLRAAGAAGGAQGEPAPLPTASADEPTRFESGPGRLLGDRVSLADVARVLESELRRAVVDETGLGGVYEIELVWAPGEPGSLVAAVEELGLEVVEARRPVEVLVVGRRE